MTDIFDRNSRIYGDTPTVELEVLIYRRPNMRDEMLEYELHMGRNVLSGLFDEMKMMPEVENVFFSFPENWLNIIEQRMLFSRLEHFCPNLKKVTIKTQSVYIIQCTPSGSAKIVASQEESEGGLPGETNPDGTPNIYGRLWCPMVGNVIGKGLNVLHSN